jgi:monofunctional biosynthetic peptidoglycan transglycosylase
MRLFGRGVAIVLAIGFGYACYVYLSLPDVRVFKTANPTTTSFMEIRAREAELRGERVVRDQRWVPYGRISQNLKRAVLVTEDSAFWTHDGVDLDQLRESVEVNLERGEFARGASTITQQLARNLYLSPSKNLVRKARELLIARRLEASLSKQRIFELYLNVIEWGDGVWGAEAASRKYFHKPASEVTAPEAALLAGAISSPRNFDPAHPSARLRRRQQMIMRRMGAATPPPVISEPTVLPVDAPLLDTIPTLPPAAPPTTLPGSVVPQEKGPGKPSGA